MSNADYIRAMSDIDLAVLFEGIASERDHLFMERLRNAGMEQAVILIETPIESRMAHFRWLQQEREEAPHDH